MVKQNYKINGKTLQNYVFEGGLKGRVFVDVIHNDKPYIITAPPRSSHEYAFSGSNRYNLHMFYVGENPQSSDQDLSGRESHGSLLAHLDDPIYDSFQIDKDTPKHMIVDRELLSRELLKI